MKSFLWILSFTLLSVWSVSGFPAANESYCFSSGIDCTGNWINTLPQEVKIGAFINDLSAFNVEESTVRFDSYVWIKWNPCAVSPTDDDEIFSPHLSLAPNNVLAKIDLTFVPTFETPQCFTDTEQGDIVYFEWRIEGQFSQKLSFKNYPVDRHWLKMSFEDNEFPREQLKYVKDVIEGDGGHPTSGRHPKSALSGWTMIRFDEGEYPSDYTTENFEEIFGSPVYSHYEFSVRIFRGVIVYMFRVLPPIVITLSISGMVLLLDVEALDTRIATAIGGLLACIFLQLTIGTNLPSQVDYLTMMDWIFNLAYILLVALVIENLYIRKVFYRLLVQQQDATEQMKLHTLSEEKAKEYAIEVKRRKDKIKRRIQRIEKILFIAYLIVGAFFLLIISLIAGLV